MRVAAAILALVCTAHAGFVKPLGAGHTRRAVRVSSQPSIAATLSEEPLEPALESEVEPEVPMPFNPAYVALGFAAFAALQPEMAMAKGGEYGIAEGRIISLAHPTVMALMYAASAFAAFTGLQWRQLRELGGTISELKQELKPLQAQVEAAGEEGAPAAVSAQVVELTAKVDELSATRKALAKDDLRDKHYQVGSLILGLGTSFAIEGPVNTFLRAGKLFPGPHLYAGAGVVVAWAMAAAMAPHMAKGKDWARTAHISLNVLALGFFTWQASPPLRPALRPAPPRPSHATQVGRPYHRPACSARVLPPAADPHRLGDHTEGHREDQVPLSWVEGPGAPSGGQGGTKPPTLVQGRGVG